MRTRLAIMVAEPPCYTVVNEAVGEYPSASDLRNSLQKGSDEVKLDTLRKIIVATINGNPQVRIRASVREGNYAEDTTW